MKYKLLIERITERLTALGISERKACINAGVNVDAVRTIRAGKSPRIETLAALAHVLKVPASYFTDAVAEALDDPADEEVPPQNRNAVRLKAIFVRGEVQAGAWREAIEWQGDDWYPITVMIDSRYPGVEAFGLEVRGSSMNRLYPEGTVLVCVRFLDLGRDPTPGEKVICLRRDRHGAMEATVKEYQRDSAGRHVLWPRSDDPEFQQPIILGGNLPVGTASQTPNIAHAGHLEDAVGSPDLWIWGLVTQSVRRE